MSDQIAIFQHFFKYFRVIVFIFLDPALWIYFLFGEFTMNLLFSLRLRFSTSKWPLNFRSVHMYIMCIWLCFRFLTPKWPFRPFWWPWDARHKNQNKILNRFIFISCAFGHIFNFWPQNDLFNPKMTFSALLMTFDDLEMHIIRIRIKFPIDLYAYHVHLDIFSIFDPKMTFFDP